MDMHVDVSLLGWAGGVPAALLIVVVVVTVLTGRPLWALAPGCCAVTLTLTAASRRLAGHWITSSSLPRGAAN